MIKKRSKKISLLLVLMMLATMFVSVGTAGAADYGISATPTTVTNDTEQELGRIKVVIEAGSIASGDTVSISLPSDVIFGGTPVFNPIAQPAVGADDNRVYVPEFVNGSDNGLVAGDIDVNVKDNKEIQLTAEDFQAETDFTFYIYLRDIDIDSGAASEVVVTFDGPTNHFPLGIVPVANTNDSGSVSVSAIDTATSDSIFTAIVRIKESNEGSFKQGTPTLKVILPDGFEFVQDSVYIEKQWGDVNVADFATSDVDGDELTLDYADADGTSIQSAIDVTFTFEAVDEDITLGDIVAKIVSNKTDSTTTEVIVGTYGESGAIVTMDEVNEVVAGMVEQEIGDILINEDLPDSLNMNKTVTFTLPSYAKFTSVPNLFSDNGLELTFVSVAGTEGNEVKYKVTDESTSNAGELAMKDVEIALDVAPAGDLKMTIGGTAGLTGEVVIAKIVPTVTAATVGVASSAKIGVSAQKMADFTITENAAGSIQEETAIGELATTLLLKVPNGFEFAKLPTVKVTSGDLELDTAAMIRLKPASTDLYQMVKIPITNTSNTASTITVSGIYITADRTVPEGPVYVAVLGNAILESNTAYKGAEMNIDGNGTSDYTVSTDGMFPATAAVTVAVVGNIATGVNNASFVIGAATYKLNGVDTPVFATSYIKDSRTYLAIRDIGAALGIDQNNILWDGIKYTVTLIKGDKVVQLTIGSKTVLINGAAVTMDVAPEIGPTNRTMLPAAFVAQAFGAVASWDVATQTVTIK